MACMKSIRNFFRRCFRPRQGHRVHPSTDEVIRQDPDQNDIIEREQRMETEAKARRKYGLMKRGKAVKAREIFKPENDADVRAKKSEEMMDISDADLGHGEESEIGHSTTEDKQVDFGHSTEDKPVGFGHSTEDKPLITTTTYEDLLADYEITKAALHEAQIRIKTLEQQLQAKTQAVSDAEGLLNDSMIMATREIEKIKRQGVNVTPKYKKAIRDLKKCRSEVDQLDSTNVKLERLVVKLEDEVKEYRVFLPFERSGALDDISENPRINYDRLLKLGTLWKSGPCTRLTPDFGLEETRSLEVLETEASQVPSVHQEPECFLDAQDAPVKRTVKDTKTTLRSDITEQVGPKPP